MARKLPAKDVVIIGLGWTGSILAYELAKAGLNVVAIERGPWRDTATDFPPAYAQDELRYAVRLDLFLRPEQETLTFRNNGSQTAMPIRRFSGFLPGNGVGGAGIHWNGQTWRFLPAALTRLVALYARARRAATVEPLPSYGVSARGRSRSGLARGRRVNLSCQPYAREARRHGRKQGDCQPITLAKPCLRRARFQKNVYASAIGLYKDSMIMQSARPSNSDFWRSFNM